MRWRALFFAALAACATPNKELTNRERQALLDAQLNALTTASSSKWERLGGGSLAGVEYEIHRLGSGARGVLAIDHDVDTFAIHSACRSGHSLAVSAARVFLETERIHAAPIIRELERKGAISYAAALADILAVRTRAMSEADVPAIVAHHLDRTLGLQTVDRDMAFTSERCVFVASGNFDRIIVLESARKKLSGLHVRSFLRPAHEVEERATSELRLSWPTSKAEAKDAAHLEAIARVLSDGDKSLLGQALLPKKARSVTSGVVGDEFEIVVALHNVATASATRDLIVKEIAQIARSDAALVSIARARIESNILSSLASINERATLLARYTLDHLDPEAPMQRWQAINEVTPVQLAAVAARWLSPERIEMRVTPPPAKPKRPRR